MKTPFQRVCAATGSRKDFLKGPVCTTASQQVALRKPHNLGSSTPDTESQVSSRISVNFPTRAAFLCTRTQNLGKRRGNYRNRPSGLIRQGCGWQASRDPVSREGGGRVDRPHPARGPALKGQTVQSRAWLLKPQREGAAGPGRYLAHPTPHGRAALAAPRSREETARGRAVGRGGGRRRQGGARSALHRRHRMAARLVGETGPRPRGRTPSAHAHLNPQFAHARAVWGGGDGEGCVWRR